MKSIPDDATGDALRQLIEGGSDLSKPMEMDFFIAVPSKEAGDKVALKASELGFTTVVEQDDVLEDHDHDDHDHDEHDHEHDHVHEHEEHELVEEDQLPEWTCYCTKTIIPEYSEVVKIEEQLDAIAKEFGGHADGFGSFGNAEEDE